MKRRLIFLCTVFLVIGIMGNVRAAPFTFDMGAGSDIDTSGTSDVLEMYASVNGNLDGISYELEPGHCHSFHFATIGTNEGWINDDDLIPGEVTAYVDFDSPEIVNSINGTSLGFAGCFHFCQGWNLTWADPVVVDLGGGSQYTIELSDVGYGSWVWQGPDGTADITATVSYGSSIPVPEPATMFLFGIGLIIFAFIARRGIAVKR